MSLQEYERNSEPKESTRRARGVLIGSVLLIISFVLFLGVSEVASLPFLIVGIVLICIAALDRQPRNKDNGESYHYLKEYNGIHNANELPFNREKSNFTIGSDKTDFESTRIEYNKNDKFSSS